MSSNNEESRRSSTSGGGGMGQPLVTIAGTVPVAAAPAVALKKTSVMSTSVSASDHPLATPSPPPPLPPLPPVSSYQQEPSYPPAPPPPQPQPAASTSTTTTMPVSLSASPMRAAASKKFGLSPLSLSLSSPPPQPSGGAVPKALMSSSSSSTAAGSPMSASSTVDDMADAFLRGDPDHDHHPLFRPLPLPQTKTDLERIRVLVERRAWGDVLSMTASMLKGPTSHYAAIYGIFLNKGGKSSKLFTSLLNSQQLEEFMEILLLQGHAWIQMRRYKELAQEVQEWSYCVFQNSDKTADVASVSVESWIPWSVHIFAAASLQYTSQGESSALTSLWNIRAAIELQMPSSVLDLIHLDLVLSNIFTAQGNWRMALQSLDRLAKLLPQGAAKLLSKEINDPAVKVLSNACQCEVWSRQGRMFLQVGALEGADTLFQQADSLWDDVPHNDHLDALRECPQATRILQQVQPQIQANFGLLQFAYKKYNLALEDFRKALECMEKLPLQGVVGNSTAYLTSDWMGGGLIAPAPRHTLYSEVASNVAVTALYTCRLQEAIHVMEHLIRRNPSETLTERSALNLCTLYELCGDAASATRKKRTLQLIAKRFFLHDIGPESFRL